MTTFGLLGPLEIRRGDERVSLAPGRPRTLLAVLLLHGNQVMPMSRLIDELWEEPPASAAKIIQNSVVRLRRVLADDSIVTRAHGYELRLADDGLDVDCFAARLDAGRRAAVEGSAEEALRAFDAALELWRGIPLADIDDAPFTAPHVRRLEALRLEAQLGKLEALLELGQPAETVAPLKELVSANPFDERAVGDLMVALYRAGRQADALEAYRACRRRLVDELGMEPGLAVRELEQAILRQELAPAAAALRARARPRPRLPLVAAACVLVAGVAVTVALVHGSGGGSGLTRLNSIGAVDATTGSRLSRVAVGFSPGPIAADARDVFVGNQGDGTLSMVDPATGEVAPLIPISLNGQQAITSIVDVNGVCWIADSSTRTVTRVGRDDSVDRLRLPFDPNEPSDDVQLAAGLGRIWVVRSAVSQLVAVDPLRTVVLASRSLPGHAIAAAAGLGAVWVISAGRAGADLLRVDPSLRSLRPVTALAGVPTAVTTGFGRVWVAIGARNVVLEIDPKSGAVLHTIAVPGGPVALVVAPTLLWVGTGWGGTLVSVDPATGDTGRTLRVGGAARQVAYSDGKLWVSGT